MTYIHSKKSDTIYSNCKMLNTDGSFMVFVGEKRMKWYIRKNLATKIDDNTFQLKFKPNGPGRSNDSDYYKLELNNKCVVCGTTHNLSLHHVVPKCFSKHFPSEYKDHNHFDVLPICISHHEEYEKMAKIKYNDYFKKFNISVEKGGYHNLDKINFNRVIKILNSLRNYSQFIPEIKQLEMRKVLSDFYQRDITKEEIPWIPMPNKKVIEDELNSFKLIVEKQTDLAQFIIDWRTHFVDSMNPKYLPLEWINDIHKVKSIV